LPGPRGNGVNYAYLLLFKPSLGVEKLVAVSRVVEIVADVVGELQTLLHWRFLREKWWVIKKL